MIFSRLLNNAGELCRCNIGMAKRRIQIDLPLFKDSMRKKFRRFLPGSVSPKVGKDKLCCLGFLKHLCRHRKRAVYGIGQPDVHPRMGNDNHAKFLSIADYPFIADIVKKYPLVVRMQLNSRKSRIGQGL